MTDAGGVAEAVGSRKVQQSRETQERLLAVGRELFSTQGYARTAMEDLVARAGMTRGALYHQYEDKKALFRAVFETVEQELGQRIAMAAAAETDPWQQLRAGARALLAAAQDPAVRRIVFTDGPSVLGWEEWRRIDEQYSLAMVRFGLEANVAAGNLPARPLEPLTHLIVGAVNEAALAVANATDIDAARAAFTDTLDWVLDALRVTNGTPATGPARTPPRKKK
jgi:AcrR family transcriptional regulator